MSPSSVGGHKTLCSPAARPPGARLLSARRQPPGVSRGILGLVGLAVTLAFAIPVGLLGVQALAAGRPVGAVYLAIAVGMVVVEEYLTTPWDLPGRAVERTVGAVVEVPDDEE